MKTEGAGAAAGGSASGSAVAPLMSKHPPVVVELAVRTATACVIAPSRSETDIAAELKKSQATLTRYAGTPQSATGALYWACKSKLHNNTETRADLHHLDKRCSRTSSAVSYTSKFKVWSSVVNMHANVTKSPVVDAKVHPCALQGIAILNV